MDKKPSEKNNVEIVLICIAVLILIAILGSALYLNSLLEKINRVEEQETLSPEQIAAILAETDPAVETDPLTATEQTVEVTTAPETQPATELPTEEITEPEEKEPYVVNILLIGQDRRINEPRQRSDAMILCTINFDKKTVVLTSFLRDTYVNIPGGYGKNRLNVPYLIGGFEMLNECLEMNFGVHVDHNVEVDFTGFKKVIDAVGGVDIELTAGEAAIVEGDQVVGMNHLDGGQTLMYARIRKLDDDFARTNRQRIVLTALYDKLKDMSIRDILELAEVIFPMLTTDMTDTEIIGYISDIFPILDELEITTQSVPNDTEFQYKRINGMSVVVPFMDPILQRLKETIGS